MKRAAGYIRRSTDDKQADSIDIQREEITKYASAHDYQIVRWYVDDGISGHDVDRDDFVR
ncbi:MAG: recombinase family protein, partial [Planctomycetales bacterium]|nr:recombinase family protein [Planctomycetales bacterium]